MAFRSGLGQGMGFGAGCLLFVLLLLVGCVALFTRGSGSAIVPEPTSAPMPSPVAALPSPVPTPTPFVASTATPVPTPTPKPTLRPAALKFGTLHYTAAGCFSSSFTDAEGHSLSGVLVDFSVTAKNTGQVKSGSIPLHVESTDWFTTTPIPFKANWHSVAYSGDEKMADIVGPKLGPGKSTTLRWSVLFQTPFDVHYVVDSGSDAHWSVWTSVKVCY